MNWSFKKISPKNFQSPISDGNSEGLSKLVVHLWGRDRKSKRKREYHRSSRTYSYNNSLGTDWAAGRRLEFTANSQKWDLRELNERELWKDDFTFRLCVVYACVPLSFHRWCFIYFFSFGLFACYISHLYTARYIRFEKFYFSYWRIKFSFSTVGCEKFWSKAVLTKSIHLLLGENKRWGWAKWSLEFFAHVDENFVRCVGV